LLLGNLVSGLLLIFFIQNKGRLELLFVLGHQRVAEN